MRGFSSQIIRGLRALRMCAVCGFLVGRSLPTDVNNSAYEFTSLGLCRFCGLRLEFCRLTEVVPGYPHETLASYVWSEDTTRFCQRMVRSLKGGGGVDLYEAFVDRWLFQPSRAAARALLWSRDLQSELVVVPAPGRESGDHAELLAAALARRLNVPYWPGLERLDQNSQKTRTSWERRLVERVRLKATAAHELQTFLQHQRRFLFVDDVITTGATAISAHRALGEPRHFAVWSLFYRPRLQP